MAKVTIVFEDFRGKSLEEDGFTHTFSYEPDEDDRPEYNGMTQAAITALVVNDILKDGAKVEAMLNLVEIEDVVSSVAKQEPENLH